MNKTAVKQFAVSARRLLTDAVRQQAYAGSLSSYDGFEKTIDAAAYCWFIRFTSLHYLEVNGFLSTGVQSFADGNRVLQAMLPEVFEPVSGWMERLLPAHLLEPDGALACMLADIPDEDWRGQVQILGWLYQYYNAERKDKVFADLRKNIKITAETLPAATQLFTPEWLAQFLVENALGRLWAEGHGKPEHALWRYYIEDAEQPAAVCTELEALRAHYRTLRPEDIRIIDPCMGSGQILLSAFDVLMDIYLSCGWQPRDAARSIVAHNLWGLDIDRQVYQLAYFSLLMKARQYDPDILETRDLRLNLACFADTAELGGEQFRHAEVCGSLLEIGYAVPAPERAAQISRILSQDYDAVITNPPYMGSSSMDPVLSEFVREHYPDSKSDLFACFIEKCRRLARPQGFYALLTMQSWMFLLSFERLRDSMMENDVVCLLHLGANAFDQGDVGTIVQAAAFVMRKTDLTAYRGTYLALETPTRPEDKISAFFAPENRYCISKEQFLHIPGHPLAYWASEQMLRHFAGEKLGDHADVRQGMTTSDNERFIRRWYETAFEAICFDAKSCDEARCSGKKWFPYNKGGGYRKWYGNHEYVVNFGDDGREMKAFHRELNKTRSGGRIKNTEYYFRRAIAWNFIALTPGFRCRPEGFIFDVAGSSLFTEDDRMEIIMAYLCSKTAHCFLHILNPTMNVQANDIKSLPYIDCADDAIRTLTQENIALCKADWDAFETSWDFAQHPLLPPRDVRGKG